VLDLILAIAGAYAKCAEVIKVGQTVQPLGGTPVLINTNFELFYLCFADRFEISFSFLHSLGNSCFMASFR
jgi:hypothetical protein